MKKKIQFSLVYRDMWQSSGKFQPRKDQLAKIAPVIIEMGCFSRVETNGGAFERLQLLFYIGRAYAASHAYYRNCFLHFLFYFKSYSYFLHFKVGSVL